MAEGDLTLRPIRLQAHDDEWRTWQGFSQIIEKFRAHPDWKDRQNKIFALREVLRRGHNAVENFLLTYQLHSLPKYPSSSSNVSDRLAAKGWFKKRCGYFDAIEAMDFYSVLDKEQGGSE